MIFHNTTFDNISKKFLIESLHIIVLGNFAFAQPLFSVLSTEPAFFTAHKAGSLDIILFCSVISFFIPFVLSLVLGLVALIFGKVVHKYVFGLMIFGLIALITLPLAKYFAQFPDLIILAAAGICALVITILYFRLLNFRTFISYLSPAIFVFPAWFLFFSPIHSMVFPPDQDTKMSNLTYKHKPPIIFVVFDEFNSNLLMNENKEIDPVFYPNMAKLSKEGYWFPNSTAVTPTTTRSLPAILSGKYYTRGKNTPHYNTHPDNLFSLLANVYTLNTLESSTNLCPPNTCISILSHRSMLEKFSSIFSDVKVVSQHIFFPKGFAEKLPSITQKHKNFADNQEIDDKKVLAYRQRKYIFKEFINSIKPEKEAALYFIHILLPHVEYEYYPSGKLYRRGKGYFMPGWIFKKGMWHDNKGHIAFAMQRYLLQVQFVDNLIGQLISKLKTEGIYDESLIVLTADHGVHFAASETRREMTKSSFKDVLSVPLFIKMPKQEKGGTNEKYVEAVDIIPTIADVLGFKVPWKVDGHSIFDNNAPVRESAGFAEAIMDKEKFEISVASLKDKSTTLAQKADLFGSVRDLNAIYSMQNYWGFKTPLYGTSITDYNKTESPSLLIIKDSAVNEGEDFSNINLSADHLPGLINGTIMGIENIGNVSDIPTMGVAINGSILAFAKPYKLDDKDKFYKFSALLPESGFRQGANKLELFLIEEKPDGSISLMMARNNENQVYELLKKNNQVVSLIDSKKNQIPIAHGYLRGYYKSYLTKNQLLRVGGWAADTKNVRTAKDVVLFYKDEFVGNVGYTNVRRAGVAKLLKSDNYLLAGFNKVFSSVDTTDLSICGVKVYAISSLGKASPLKCATMPIKELKSRLSTKDVGSFAISKSSFMSYRLNDPLRYRAVDLDSLAPVEPISMRVHIEKQNERNKTRTYVIAVEGKFQEFITVQQPGRNEEFVELSIPMPREAFVQGENKIDLYLVNEKIDGTFSFTMLKARLDEIVVDTGKKDA